MTDQDWLENLNISFKLNVPHIFSYALSLKFLQTNSKNSQTNSKQFDIDV